MEIIEILGNFQEQLKILRKSRNLTQKQIAERLGIDEADYRKYELGKRLPSFESLLKLSRCFNVSLDSLMTGEEFRDITAQNIGKV